MREQTLPVAPGDAAAEPAEPHVTPDGGTLPVDPALSDPAPADSTREPKLLAGETVDRYRVVRLIASGGMARVYEAVHAFTQKPVALKVMHHRFSERDDVVERFRKEAMVLSSIRHENVVIVENAGLTSDGHVFIAMELLNGQNLRDLLKLRRRLPPKEALELVAQVADGVAAAHEINVVHRDLKPENIFCTGNGMAKVLDLGTAKFAGENAPSTQTAYGTVIGTAAYIAPERLLGEPGDTRGDIYALGLVLYECIAGHHPLVPSGEWPSPAEIAARQVTFHPRPVAGVPDAVSSVIAKAIHKKPERRYKTMREMALALRRARMSLMAQPSVPPQALPAAHAGGFRREVVLGVAAGVSFALVGFALLHLRTGARPEPKPAMSAAAIASVPATPTVPNAPAIPNSPGRPPTIRASITQISPPVPEGLPTQSPRPSAAASSAPTVASAKRAFTAHPAQDNQPSGHAAKPATSTAGAAKGKRPPAKEPTVVLPPAPAEVLPSSGL
jgi:serine/threonine protein kinase